MTNSSLWFELPREIKLQIFSYVHRNNSAIVYVPRDRRYKVDHNHLYHPHFHNLLLVSKTFITPVEFASAIFAENYLKFTNVNGITRFLKEVDPTVKQLVRFIHLRRSTNAFDKDVFSSWSNIETKLSTNFPDLKQVVITLVPFPGQHRAIGEIEMPRHSNGDPEPRSERDRFLAPTCPPGAWEYYLSDGHIPAPIRAQSCAASPRLKKCNPNLTQCLAADFLGDYSSATRNVRWNRPHDCLKRIIRYCLGKDIDVRLDFPIYINCCDFYHTATLPPWHRQAIVTARWSLSATCSVKDWVVRVVVPPEQLAGDAKKPRLFKIPQELARDVIMFDGKRDRKWREHAILDRIQKGEILQSDNDEELAGRLTSIGWAH